LFAERVEDVLAAMLPGLLFAPAKAA